MAIDWNKRAHVSGETIAERLLEQSRSKEAINACLEQFEADIFMAFIDHNAPDPETLTAIAMTVARKTLLLLH